MAIAYTLTADSLDELAEPLRAAAKEVGGKFVVNGLPEGFAVENVKGLRSALQTTREERDAEKAAAKAFREAGLTPEQAKEAAEAYMQKKAGKLTSNEELAAFKKQLEDKFANDSASIKKGLDEAEAELRENLIRGELGPVIAQMGGAEAMDAILTLSRPHIRVSRDEATGKRRLEVVDARGAVRNTKKAGSSDPMGSAELIAEMREAQSTKGLFAVRNAGGSGSTSQSRGPAPAGQQQDSTTNLSSSALFRLANEQAAASAGSR